MRTLLSTPSGVQHARNTASGLHGEAQADSVRAFAALVSPSISFLRLS
ncbi:hypothetical protein MYCO108962_07425 [Mycobacterium colombiense]